LIIESVTRILDDTALEDRVIKKKKGITNLHEPGFRTGPPSEVHQNFMHTDPIKLFGPQLGVGADFEMKWQN
jgi:hypothetical protein